MNNNLQPVPITIALPKGRLQQQIFAYFAERGIHFEDHGRNLIVEDTSKTIRALLVRGVDVPEYVYNGSASIGISGTDTLRESRCEFFPLGIFPFGKTRICLISSKNTPPIDSVTQAKVATKYVNFTKNFLQERDIHAHIIKLNGSTEIAPLLGLAPYIVDLVETGRTIKENGLIVLEEIGNTQVTLIANKALYKLNYKAIDKVVRTLKL